VFENFIKQADDESIRIQALDKLPSLIESLSSQPQIGPTISQLVKLTRSIAKEIPTEMKRLLCQRFMRMTTIMFKHEVLQDLVDVLSDGETFPMEEDIGETIVIE
jgi:hypothetical protein